MVVEQLQVSTRYETGMSHIDVNLTATRVAADHNPLLAYEVLEVAAVKPRDRSGGRLLRPLYLGGRGRRRLEREQRPCIALGAPRELSLCHGA